MRLTRGRYLRLGVLVVAALAFAGAASSAGARGAAPVFPRDLREISYYPADGGWGLMWSSWRPDRYASDFRRIRALGANTVRVIVQTQAAGYPQPTAAFLDKLHQLVGMAEAAGLYVHLTLFDWFDRFGDLAGSKQWAASILERFVGDERIGVVEVKNELETGNPTVLAWTRAMIPYLQTLLRQRTPVTASVAGADQLAGLVTLRAALGTARPDFYSLHAFGGSGEQIYWALQKAARAVAPVPLWVGETGYPSIAAASGYGDLPPTPSAQEAAQAHYLKTVAAAAWRNALPPIGVWGFSDFQPGAIPAQAAGQAVLTPEAEYHFGLVRADGSAKPAADVVRRIFTRPQPPIDFNNGFESAVLDSAGRPFPAEWSGGAHPNGELVQDTSVGHTRRASARLRSTDGHPTLGSLYVTPTDASVPTGATATATVWVRSRSRGAQVRLALVWLGPGSTHVGTQEARLPPGATGWRQLRVRMQRPVRARSARIYLKVANSPGTVWFDDVGWVWVSKPETRRA